MTKKPPKVTGSGVGMPAIGQPYVPITNPPRPIPQLPKPNTPHESRRVREWLDGKSQDWAQWA